MNISEAITAVQNVGWAQLDAMRQAGLLDQAVADREAQLTNGQQGIEPQRAIPQ
jgi:hypothetical protein